MLPESFDAGYTMFYVFSLLLTWFGFFSALIQKMIAAYHNIHETFEKHNANVIGEMFLSESKQHTIVAGYSSIGKRVTSNIWSEVHDDK
jgi:hypothetical protein